MATIRELADRTPATRRRHVDLLRAVAIAAVVVGHWLVIAVERDATGRLTGFSALGQIPGLHALTWLFQVMPVFFLVGGASNAISWQRHRNRGGSSARWLLDRAARVLPPVVALVLAVAVGAIAARAAGVDPGTAAEAVHLVTLPLWFLVVYVAVIALTPVACAAHERWGLAVPLVLLAGVAIGDALHLATGQVQFAYGNYACAWLAVHQVGIAWQDGSLGLTPRRSTVLLVVAGVALVLLTGPGPYPVSMVSVPGAPIQNSGPPTLALMALAAVQIAVVGLVAGPADRWLARPGPWRVVVAVNVVVLTLFLWHMVAALAGALTLDALGLLPAAPVGSAQWWAGRVPWLATATAFQVVLVAAFAWVETGAARRLSAARRRAAQAAAAPPGPEGEATGRWRAVAGAAGSVLASTPAVVAAYAATVLGLFVLAYAGRGPHGPFVIPTSALVLLLSGSAALALGWAWASRAPGVSGVSRGS